MWGEFRLKRGGRTGSGENYVMRFTVRTPRHILGYWNDVEVGSWCGYEARLGVKSLHTCGGKL